MFAYRIVGELWRSNAQISLPGDCRAKLFLHSLVSSEIRAWFLLIHSGQFFSHESCVVISKTSSRGREHYRPIQSCISDRFDDVECLVAHQPQQ